MTEAAAAPGLGPRRDLVFVHIPKTAGTSLRIALARRPAGRRVLQDYGPAPETSDAIRALRGPPSRHARLRREVEAPGGLLLMGHFPARRYWDAFNADSFVAFVRDPVARVVSEWNHHVSHRGITQDLMTYAAVPNRRNLMGQMLGPSWRHFGFIGLTERYADCLPALSAHLGQAVPAERRNLGLYPETMPGGRVDEATAAAIASLNLRDLALYEAIRARWDAEGRWRPHPPVAPPRMVVRRAARQAGLWRGWCADPEGIRTWTVAVLHAGREVACFRAEGHAPRLAAHGATRTGIGHFAFDAEAVGLPADARPEFAVVLQEDSSPATLSPRAAE